MTPNVKPNFTILEFTSLHWNMTSLNISFQYYELVLVVISFMILNSNFLMILLRVPQLFSKFDFSIPIPPRIANRPPWYRRNMLHNVRSH